MHTTITDYSGLKENPRNTRGDVIILDKRWQTSAIFCFSCSRCSLSFSRFFISCMALPASLAAPLYCAMLPSLPSALAFQTFKIQTMKTWIKFDQKTHKNSLKCGVRLPSSPQQEKWRRRSACRVADIYDAFHNLGFSKTQERPSQAVQRYWCSHRIFSCYYFEVILLNWVIILQWRDKSWTTFIKQ